MYAFDQFFDEDVQSYGFGNRWQHHVCSSANITVWVHHTVQA
jgi:hypothetical protein